MVAAKGRALAALGAQTENEPGKGPRRHPIHVASWHALAADLSGTDWVRALVDAGFEPGRPTLWIVEGLFMYLEPQAATDLLRLMQREPAWSGAGMGGLLH